MAISRAQMKQEVSTGGRKMKKKLDKRELLTQHTLYKSALLKIYKQSVENIKMIKPLIEKSEWEVY